MMDSPEQPFWKTKALADMTPAEWESLCDGCAKCCLHKLEDPDTGAITYTSVVCRYLDLDSCRCQAYADRFSVMPDCAVLTPDTAVRCAYLPKTCAYRLIAEGKDLPEWHPLVTGDPESVHEEGVSVRFRVISEIHADINRLEAYALDDPL